MNKRINFNIKDRKVLYVILCIVLISTFTLTIAYAALNAVLTISGNAQITSADWDIHLANPKVTNGSATTNVPQIKTNSTMDFTTTLNMPGDFYEFTVDVVNSGSIDAMIESVIKNPELDASQKKYLNYEVTYQNGESITQKQTLSKGTTMPIKVRIEYRKDLVASDLPTGQVVLDLSLTLEYIQSDGTGTTVSNNGVGNISVNGSLYAIGTIVTIGSEQFYTIGTEGNNVKLLSMYNLMVGNEVNISDDGNPIVTPLANSTGLQSEDAIGLKWDVETESPGFPWYGTVAFATEDKHGTNYSDYSGSLIETYVNDYAVKLESMGVNIESARLITKEELIGLGCNDSEYTCTGTDYPWIYSTSYWSGSASNTSRVWYVISDGMFGRKNFSNDDEVGVRPVIIISKDYFPAQNEEISFTIAGVSYQAMNGMTWEEWLASDYAPANAYSNYAGANIVISVAGYDVQTSEGTYVTLSDTIISGHAYITGSSSEPR